MVNPKNDPDPLFPPHPPQQHTLLLVEDNPDDQFLMQYAIQEARIPHQLQIVEDGGQAIDYLSGAGNYSDRERYPLPSIVFLDLKMPRVDGFQVLDWRRQQPDLAHIPIIVLTSSKEMQNLAMAYKLGASSYIVKPATPFVIQEKIRVHLFTLAHPLRLAVIDDSDNERIITVHELRSAFPDASVADVGTPAGITHLLEEDQFDLVITDFNAPGWNGLDVLRAIKARYPNLPVIICTNTAKEQDLLAALSIGLDDYVLKAPLDRARLPNAILSAIARNEQRRATYDLMIQWQTTFDMVSDGICLLDGDYRILRTNEAMVRICGKSSSEMVGRYCWEVVHGTDIPIPECPIQKVKLSLHRETFEVRKGDQWLQVSVDPILGEERELSGAVLIMADITERKKSEERLRLSMDRLAMINRLDRAISTSLDIDTVYDAFIIEMRQVVAFDLSSIILTDEPCERWHIRRQWTIRNPNYQSLEWRPVEGTALSWVVEHRHAFLGDLENNGMICMENEACREEGIQSWALLPLLFQGKVIGVLTFGSQAAKAYQEDNLGLLQSLADQLAIAVQNANLYTHARLTAEELDRRVKERTAELQATQEELKKSNMDLSQLTRQLEDRVKQRTEELRAKNEEITIMSEQLLQASKLATVGELAAGIAHELNNPLATISLRTESLIHRTPAEDPQHRALSIIAQEVERMGKLVTNLLQFSRRSQPQISTIDLREEVDHALELIYYRLQKHQITLSKLYPSELPCIHGERQQLRQLFLNLFNNAIDAMEGTGGVLSIEIRVDQGDVLTGGTQTTPPDHPHTLVIEIKDNGTGIPPELISKVSEAFFTTKPEGKGTGLGLPICRRIVKEHGGVMNILSEGLPGKGTTIQVVLPLNEQPSR